MIPEDITVCIPGVAFCNSKGKERFFELKIQSLIWLPAMCEKQNIHVGKIVYSSNDTVGLTSAGKWNTWQLMLSFWGWQRSANCCVYNGFEMQRLRALTQGLTRTTTRSQHQLYKVTAVTVVNVSFNSTNLIAMCTWSYSIHNCCSYLRKNMIQTVGIL